MEDQVNLTVSPATMLERSNLAEQNRSDNSFVTVTVAEQILVFLEFWAVIWQVVVSLGLNLITPLVPATPEELPLFEEQK
jgi:hypothetical protein